MTSKRKTAPIGEEDTRSPLAQYVAEVELYERETEKWGKRRKEILRRYKDDRDSRSKATQYNSLWAITQTLLPALYARNPKPDIQRRFKDADPIGRVASDVLERCVTYFTDTDKFSACMRQVVFDYAVPGRGSAWVRYNPTIVKETAEITDQAEEGTGGDNEEAPLVERLAYEDLEVDYVQCGDMGHNICRTWDEVWLTWRIVYMTREEMITRFGKEKGKLPPLDYRDKNLKDETLSDSIGKAVIYEGWDKSKKKAVWFHKTTKESLDDREDPLKLKDFFPCPKPLFANLANDSLIPTPDFIEYQDQAVEMDNLTARIASVTKSLKVAGVYAGDAQAVGRLLNEGVENKLIAIEQWAMFADKGGLKGVIELLPLDQIANALTALYAARDKVKADLYEITGIADIIRGNSNPNETAAAQQIKSNFATMRLSDRQRDVQRFAREIVRIMVDMIAGHFQLDTIKTISGVRLLTNAEKQAFAPYANMPAVAPGGPGQGAPGGAPPPMGHNGGPPMEAPPQMAGGQPQMAQMQAQPAMMQAEQHPQQAMMGGQQMAPHPMPPPMQGQPPAPGPMPQMPMPQGMPPPPLPPLPSGVTLDQMHTMLTDPSWEEVDALIRNEPLRSFRIDIETDSTIKTDEDQDKQDGLEFIKAVGSFLQQAESVAQSQPTMLPLMAQLLMFGVRRFQVGKDLEGAFNAAIASLEKQAANPQQKPNPEMAKIQSEEALEQLKAKNKMALEQAQTENDAKTDQLKAQSEAQTDQQQNQLEYQRRMEELQSTERVEKYKIDKAAETQIRIAHINSAGKIASAQVTAGASDGAQDEAREAAGEGGTGSPDNSAPATGAPQDQALHDKMDLLMGHLASKQSQPAPMPAAPPQQQPDLSAAVDRLAQAHQQTQEHIAHLHKAITSEKEIVRDPKTGRPTGIRIKPAPGDVAKALIN